MTWTVRTVTAWTDADVDALADLERRVVAVDGGRLKLELATLRPPATPPVTGLLAERDGVLLGALGVYAWGGPAELAGGVDPAVRRQGLGTALLQAALALCADDAEAPLLVTSPVGNAFAQARGGEPAHVETALVLADAASVTPSGLVLRPATAADVPALQRLLSAGFDEPVRDLTGDLPQTLVLEADGALQSTLRLDRDGDTAGVYAFVVDPDLQGRGLGRAVLQQACADAAADGVRTIALEVVVGNDRALGLYTSLGFRPRSTEHYWRLPRP